MLQNNKGANTYFVDSKSWIVGERKISIWSGSKCNKSEDVIKSEHVIKSEDVIKSEHVIKSEDDKIDD
jgi:hypothetical protein